MSLLQDEFAQADGLRYLNHAAVAPWPKRATRAVQSFAEENCRLGARDYPDWIIVERRLRERLARLLNTPATADLALVKNTSEALSFVAFGLDWSAGDQVVISDQEFPSNRVVWEALKRFGVNTLQVPLNGSDPEGALIAAIGPRTRLLSNADGQVVHDGRDVLKRIVTQISNPVRWDKCMETMAELGVTGVLELPPAGTLVGLEVGAHPVAARAAGSVGASATAIATPSPPKSSGTAACSSRSSASASSLRPATSTAMRSVTFSSSRILPGHA